MLATKDQIYGLPVKCLLLQPTLWRYSQLEPEQTKQVFSLCCQYVDSLESDLTRRRYERNDLPVTTAYC